MATGNTRSCEQANDLAVLEEHHCITHELFDSVTRLSYVVFLDFTENCSKRYTNYTQIMQNVEEIKGFLIIK